MGISKSHSHTHNIFLFCNYILLGAASSCIFLTLSLRLFPSLSGFFFILLQVFTISAAVSGCNAVSSSSYNSHRWYGAHMVITVLTAIFQGSVSVLVFTRTGDFLQSLKSYVQEDDGCVILKLAGGLCILMFCLEWVVLVLAFFLKFHDYLKEGANGSIGGCVNEGSTKQEEGLKDWPSYPLQIKF